MKRMSCLFLIICAGCGEESYTSLSVAQAHEFAFSQQVLQAAGGSSVVVCGPAKGKQLFADDRSRWTNDKVADGRIAFVSRAQPDIIYRDIGPVRSATVDGGEVRVMYPGPMAPFGVWVVMYKETGVVETHNLSVRSDGKILDLWTSNKPPIGTLPSRMFAFTSDCMKV